MDYYVGLDVSLRSVAVCVINADGGAVLERSVACEIEDIAQCLAGFDVSNSRIAFEAGAMSQHLFFGLRAAGFDVVCMEARQVNAALSAMRNKTDKTDARGIAQVLRSGWFNPVHMKSREAHAVRALLSSRKAVQRKCIDLANEIRGLFRIFGLRLPSRVDQSSFDERVRPTIEADPDLSHALLPLLDAPAVLYQTYRGGIVRAKPLETGRASPWLRRMTKRSPFRYFKTSPEIIRLAVMLYVRFPLSLRNVEDLLHERGIDVSHEAVRYWWHRFGPMFAAEIRKRRIEGMRSSRWRWHLDEMFVKINGEMHYLLRAVDHEGEVLESFVTKRRDKKAALKFSRKAMRKHGRAEVFVTDRLRPYGAALKEIGAEDRQETGRWLNNRAENSHLSLRRRKRALLRFWRMRSLQKFASVHASVFNHFNQERSLYSRANFKTNRAAALTEWRSLCAA